MTNLKSGLTSLEVENQIKNFGYNEFEDKKISVLFSNFIKIFVDPMGMMLLVLSIIYWILGEHNDSIILLLAYIPIVGVDVLLELRSQKALNSLKRTLKSTCHVVRDSLTIAIATRNLVPGDLLILEEGQTLPADGIIVDAANLTIDESSLTGESIPIEKSIGEAVLSGTSIITGSGIIEIQKTGLSSQMGTIAKILKEFDAVPSPLLRSINRIVKYAFLIALLIAVIIFVEGMLKSKGFASSLISALTLAMAAIPEEFPLVFTLYLSLAAYRLSKKGVLVKSLPAVEGLGRVDIICTDKTGTLTEGKFRLEKIIRLDANDNLNDDEVKALAFSCELKAVDAMESSIYDWLATIKDAQFINELHQSWTLEFDNQFDTLEKYMSHVWKNSETGIQMIAMKGAIEGVINHCELSMAERTAVLNLANLEAESGRRLLGLAMKVRKFSGLRTSDEHDLKFVGILSFTDPIRPSVTDALRLCGEQGIKVKMLTGDHLLTAHSIADKIALPHKHDELFTGPDLEKMTLKDRAVAFQKGVIFARLKPEQKLQLVETLKANGNVVAMTGDGINDAPALKLADIGISMGDKATDVARSTAQLILLKNDFGGIIASVIEGRRVLKSLSQSFGYLIAFHIPIIGLALYQAFFLESSILLPIHIVLMELIVHPVSAFVFNESGIGSAERQNEFISKKAIIWSSIRGILLTLLSIVVFHFGPGPVELRRSLAVLMLVTGNIGLLLSETGGPILAVINFRKFRNSWWATLILMLLALTLAYIPKVTTIFSLQAPSLLEFIIISGVGLILGQMTPSLLKQNKK
jgi:Ca2+-transporting ATPase